MFDSSVIKQTGQWWKLIVSFFGVLLGGGVIFLADHCRKQWGAELWGITMLGGSAFSLGCFCFACLSIRCPTCRSRWFWDGVRGQGVRNWLAWLLSQRTCPRCGHPKETHGSQPA